MPYTYTSYLRLDELLGLQTPASGGEEHDEMLFIVIHQASELWIKLCLHEIGAAIRQVRKDELGPAFKMMARVARIVFAACDPKGGAVLHGPRFFEQPTCHHRPVIARAAALGARSAGTARDSGQTRSASSTSR